MTPIIRDTIERLFWTFVAAFLGGLSYVGLFDLDVSALQSAAAAGFAALVNGILLVARWRLSVLPDPGRAIAEETATETYRQIDVGGRL